MFLHDDVILYRQFEDTDRVDTVPDDTDGDKHRHQCHHPCQFQAPGIP